MRAGARPSFAVSRLRALTILAGFGAAAASTDSAQAAAATSLRLIAPDGYRAGIPLLVRLDVLRVDGTRDTDLWDAEAILNASTGGAVLTPSRVRLRNGIGSALVTLDGSGDVEIVASLGILTASKTVHSLASEAPVQTAGTLSPGLTEWQGIVQVTADLLVPAGATLRIHAGTLVLVAGVASGENGSDIDVAGRLEVLGTAASPVTFTATDPSQPWGEIHHQGAEPSLYRFALLTRAGHSPRGGHTNTGPAVRTNGATVAFESSAISDNAGKVMQATGSDVSFRDTLLARSVMGPEVEGTALVFEDGAIVEMFGADDNDGIYLHDQAAGQTLRISRSIIADGDDDGIDTLGADELLVEDSILRDWNGKGISIFHDSVTLRRCIIVNNDTGISAKTSNTGVVRARVDQCTVAGNRLGLEARDKFADAPNAQIFYDVSSSIVRRTAASDSRTIRTDYAPSFFTVRYSDLTDILPGINGSENITADPAFAGAAAGDYHLSEGSPCIDGGDPATPLDADGSRADMGALPYIHAGPAVRMRRGELTGDGSYDVSDPITLLLFLFAGGALDCPDAGDANDDGQLDLTDPVLFLRHLFAGGPPPSAPFGTCGTDGSEDALECIASPCG